MNAFFLLKQDGLLDVLVLEKAKAASLVAKAQNNEQLVNVCCVIKDQYLSTPATTNVNPIYVASELVSVVADDCEQLDLFNNEDEDNND